MRKAVASAGRKRVKKLSHSILAQELVRARKELQKESGELADLLAVMHAALESTTDAIVLTDGAAKVTGFNENYCEMMGMSRRQVMSASVQKLRERFSRLFKDPKKFIADTKAIYAAALPETFDVMELADGRVFERYSKLQKIDKRTVGRVWNFRDVTERKRSEEKLQAAKIAAERASKAKDDFLALLSHELRTPLTPALAAASYLAEHEDLQPEFREEVTAIMRNIQLEARLIDDLLDVTKIARGKIALRRELTDAHGLLRDALEVGRKGIHDKKIRVGTELDAVDHYVFADPVRIRQVLWNLINNGVKFTNRGGRITIRTFNQEKRLVFEIADTGIGIEPGKQGEIFDAFEQGEPSLTRQFGGLGLGLAICKTLVDLHNGEISVHSAGKNQGATFRVELDTAPTPAVPLVPANGRPRGVSRSLNVLVVDDHADTRDILARLLTKCG